MKLFLIVFVFTVLLFLTSSVFAAGTYSGLGDGSTLNPYRIATASHMQEIGEHQEDWDKNFILTANINLAAYTGTSFHIIGNGTKKFSGTFDGGGHTIDNFSYTSTEIDYIGLFSRVGEGGIIKNLELTNVSVDSGNTQFGASLVGFNDGGTVTNSFSTGSVSGYYHVGGLIGVNESGLIINCFSTASVNGNMDVGGLVGKSHGNSIVGNCYSTGSVNGISHVGGLVGYNAGVISKSYSAGPVNGTDQSAGGLAGVNADTILNSYSTSTVIGDSSVGGLVGSNASGGITDSYSNGSVNGTSNVGGLVGNNSYGTLRNSYSTGSVSGTSNVGALVGQRYRDDITNSYFLDTAGPDNGRGTPLSDTAMRQPGSFRGWDFIAETANGTSQIWQMPVSGGYPVLCSFNGYAPVLSGSGTEVSPYLISNPDELGAIYHYSNAWYSLIDDIDLAGITWSTAVVPVFRGSFEGNGYVISNLTIHGGNNTGLFGYLYSGGVVSHTRLEHVSVSGENCVGGLVGGIYMGKIAKCYSTGYVTGHGNVGGLAGGNYYGSIKDCYSTGSLYGDFLVGGLLGNNYSGEIESCYSTASVRGTRDVGGLVGCSSQDGTLTNNYSTGSVTGTGERTGGLVGRNYNSILANSFSTGDVTGTGKYVGGLVGLNSDSSISNSYSVSSVIGNDYAGGLVGCNEYGGIVKNVYSAGDVTGPGDHIGGLVGYSYVSVKNSYFLDDTGPDNGDGTPLTDHSMRLQGSFAGWDFNMETANGNDDVWHMPYQSGGYPMLFFQRDIPGDLQGSYGVDLADTNLLSAWWNETGCQSKDNCDGTDTDQSGTVDIIDLVTVMANWLEGK